MDHSFVPEGFLNVHQAARIIGVPAECLMNRQWLRRRGIPVQQLRRHMPIFFSETELRAWITEQMELSRARRHKPKPAPPAPSITPAKRGPGRPRKATT